MKYHIWALFILAAQGCIPFSKHPLTDPRVDDTAIYGKWSAKKNGKTSYLDIKPSKQKNIFIIRYEESGDPHNNETMELNGSISVLNGKSYLNLKITQARETFPEGYIVCQYLVDKNTLNLTLMDPDLIQSDIHSKKLEGKIEDDTLLPYTRIIEGQNKLQKYIVKYSDRLFVKGVTFYKENAQ